jgi:predicted aminopeptidase
MRVAPLQYRLVALVTLGALVLGSCTACSPGYVMRGAYEQGKILLARREIREVLGDPEVSPENKEKLSIVLDARAYATRIGLNPGGAFTSYAEVSRDPLAWVVVASRRDAFALHTWWFPIVGTVPYKGFFDKDDAEAQVKELKQDGYEVSMRGTEAFSTLGWFDDPVVSTTLKNSSTRIANTVIHESVHSTVWIPGGVAFNESLANFVGSQGAENFFSERLKTCQAMGGGCELEAQQLAGAKRDYAFQLELAEVVDALYNRLDQLYRDPVLSADEKIARRVGVFAEVMTPFRAKYPSAQILKEVNNADIIQLKLYLSKLWLFHELFVRQNRDWEAFMGAMRRIQKEMSSRDQEAANDPFILLQDIVGTHS